MIVPDIENGNLLGVRMMEQVLESYGSLLTAVSYAKRFGLVGLP